MNIMKVSADGKSCDINVVLKEIHVEDAGIS
jgi:hypothetical protein